MNTYWEKKSPALLVLLASFIALGPLSTDMYLPAFPAMVAAFTADAGQIQLTLSAYLVGYCLFHLVCGPLSDRYGRKPVLLWGLLIFFVASVACSLAASIEQLIFWRCIQGVGACAAPVVARAMVRDMYSPQKALKALASMGAIMAIAPIIAPIIGGWMLGFWLWSSIFVFMGLYSVLCIVMLYGWVPESLLKKQSMAFSVVFGNYWELIKHRQYRLNVLSASFLFAGMFIFLSNASFILIDLMAVPAEQFGYWFMLIVIGYMLGSLLIGRYAHQLTSKQIIIIGLLLTLISSLVMIVLCYLQIDHPLVIILPQAVYACGIGVIMPNAMAEAMAPFANFAGTASALMGFLQMAIASVAIVISSLLFTAAPLPLAFSLMICASIAFILYWQLLKKATSVA